jgi:hypothetical protein
MREVFGDLFSYVGRKGFILCITTNGFIKHNGEGVMGAGVAKQAAELFPDLPRLLGQSLRVRGNVVSLLTPQILSFPVKWKWMEDADPKLIEKSAKELKRRAELQPDVKFILPRPGCGNGKLEWESVKTLLESIQLPDNILVIAPWKERPKL